MKEHWRNRNKVFSAETRSINRKSTLYSFGVGAALPTAGGVLASFTSRLSLEKVWIAAGGSAAFMGVVAIALMRDSFKGYLYNKRSLRSRSKN